MLGKRFDVCLNKPLGLTGSLASGPTEVQEKLGRLQNTINYQFKDVNLLKNALTHSSLTNQTSGSANEETFNRLEFFGDAVLNAAVSEYLLNQFSCYSSGQLSEQKSRLVCNEACFLYGAHLQLHRYIEVSEALQNSDDPKVMKTILADTFEAFLGSIAKDSSQRTAQHLFNSKLKKVVEGILENSQLGNWKQDLQKYAESQSLRPIYQSYRHNSVFHVSVSLEKAQQGPSKATKLKHKSSLLASTHPVNKPKQEFHGHGRSIQAAEKSAAHQALSSLGLTQPPQQPSHVISIDKIVTLDLGEICYQTRICMHFITIVLNDGRILHLDYIDSRMVHEIIKGLPNWRITSLSGWKRKHFTKPEQELAPIDALLTMLAELVWPLFSKKESEELSASSQT